MPVINYRIFPIVINTIHILITVLMKTIIYLFHKKVWSFKLLFWLVKILSFSSAMRQLESIYVALLLSVSHILVAIAVKGSSSLSRKHRRQLSFIYIAMGCVWNHIIVGHKLLNCIIILLYCNLFYYCYNINWSHSAI